MRSHLANQLSRPKPTRIRKRLLALAILGALSACADPNGALVGGTTVTFERRIVSAVNFDFDSYRIRPDSYALLDNAAIALNDPQLAGLRFEINGHTDITGRLSYNIALSQLRAAAVVDYLSARGVPRDRMRAQGFGPLQPYDSFNLRSPANRRVEIVALR